MPKKYCLALLILVISGISVAKADQIDNLPTGSGKGNPDKVATSTAIPFADPPMFKFGGFGSFGGSHSTQGLGDYVLDSSMPKGAGRSSEWSASNTTRLAAHVNANFTPKLSGLFQVDSEYHSDGTYRPEIEWISIKYAITPNFYVRAGRIVLPTFLDSENRDVGFSYVWVNPPVDLYHQLSIPSSDGIDAMYRSQIGEAGNTVKVIYGKNTLDRPTSVTTSKEMWGIFDTLEIGQATFLAGYQQRQSSTQSNLNGTGPWVENEDLSFGVNYDPGEWFITSEWIQRRSTYKTGAMYISAGYRIDKFTPYLIHSQNSQGSFFKNTTPTASALQLANRSQSTNSIGMRWDFYRNFDFKIQYDHVTLSDHSNGYLINVPTNTFLYGTSFHVVSAVVDFVF